MNANSVVVVVGLCGGIWALAQGCDDGPVDSLPAGSGGGSLTAVGSTATGLGGSGTADPGAGGKGGKGGDEGNCPPAEPDCAPEVVAEEGGTDLTVTPTHVVWTNAMTGELRRAPIAGGKAELLVGGQAAPRKLTTDGLYVYWTSAADGKIRRIEADAPEGTAAEELAGAAGPAQAITNDGATLYWAEGGNVHSQPIGSANPTVVMSGTAFVSVLAPGDTDLFFTSPDNGIYKTAKSGGVSSSIATDEASPWGIGVDQTAVYWITTGTPCSVRRRTQQGELTTFALTGDSCAFGPLAIDATHVYWPTWQSQEIWQADKATGTVLRVAGNAGHVPAMALDATHVYWISSSHPRIMRMPKK